MCGCLPGCPAGCGAAPLGNTFVARVSWAERPVLLAAAPHPRSALRSKQCTGRMKRHRAEISMQSCEVSCLISAVFRLPPRQQLHRMSAAQMNPVTDKSLRMLPEID